MQCNVLIKQKLSMAFPNVILGVCDSYIDQGCTQIPNFQTHLYTSTPDPDIPGFYPNTKNK